MRAASVQRMPSTEIIGSPTGQVGDAPHRMERSIRRLDLDPRARADATSRRRPALRSAPPTAGRSSRSSAPAVARATSPSDASDGRGDRHPFRLRCTADPVHLRTDAAQQPVGHRTIDHASRDVQDPDLVTRHQPVLVAGEVEDRSPQRVHGTPSSESWTEARGRSSRRYAGGVTIAAARYPDLCALSHRGGAGRTAASGHGSGDVTRRYDPAGISARNGVTGQWTARSAARRTGTGRASVAGAARPSPAAAPTARPSSARPPSSATSAARRSATPAAAPAATAGTGHRDPQDVTVLFADLVGSTELRRAHRRRGRPRR